MPTGTRSSISTNNARKPMMATASVLIASLDRLDFCFGHQFRPDNQAVGADSDQQHRRHVAQPGDHEERPGRQAKIEGEHVVGARGHHLVAVSYTHLTLPTKR